MKSKNMWVVEGDDFKAIEAKYGELRQMIDARPGPVLQAFAVSKAINFDPLEELDKHPLSRI